jgi:ferredoxin-like protein FixX
MTATVAGAELEEKLKEIQVKLGEYPHSEVMMHKKKQSARMLKHVCELDCGASCYQSAKQSSENPMLCSNCSGWDDDAEEFQEVYMLQA